MANIIEVTCPHCNETFEVEIPKLPKKPRGQLAGISLSDMTNEQLKRELINSKSVLYKAKQRGASEEIIAKNQARVDAAMAEKASRVGTTETADDESVYDEGTAEEV